MQRRLAAILLTDMVGYSRLMGLDEEGTIARQKAHRQEVFDPKINQYGGRVVKTTGDGLLVEFPSVVDAVKCAVDVQTELAGRDIDVPEERRVQYRIGINLGDIVIDGDDILGDGVNVAARLEGLASPGGICISAVVHDQVSGKLNFAFDDAGETELKNITNPIQVWHWVAFNNRRQPTSAHKSPSAPSASDKASIAILPFVNLSSDPEQEFFTDGVTDDITTALSKFSELLVISRGSAFAYKGKSIDLKNVAKELGVRFVLQGSVRWGKERVRISAQLSDTESGGNLWAEKFDRDSHDLFALQDEITEEIVRAIEPQIGHFERSRVVRIPPSNLDAWGHYHRGLAGYYEFTSDSLERAIEHFDKAIELDPHFAPALAMAAASRAHLVLYGKPEDREKLLETAQRQSALAVSLAPTEPICCIADAQVHNFFGRYDIAIEKLHQALKSNPNSGLALYQLGYSYLVSGQAEKAIEHFQQLLRLSPHDALATGWITMLSVALFDLGRYEEAIEHARHAVARPNPRVWAYAFLAAALHKLGQTDEASEVLKRVYSIAPSFSLQFVRKAGAHWAPDMLANRLRLLEEAGVPEQPIDHKND